MKHLLQKGYVIIPRNILNSLFENHHQAQDYDEAFLRVLAYVNYKSVKSQWNGHPVVCARGESIYTYTQWAELLGWTRPRTVYFFRKMMAENLIRHVESACPTHIHLNCYEDGEWQQSSTPEVYGRREADGGFEEFWERYHEYTQTSKVNKERARRVWRKLPIAERKLAVDAVEEYSYHHPDTRFCLQAARYLSDKAFMDEYLD